MPTSAVIICAHTDERRPQIVRAVQSVREQVPAPEELVLVSDHNEGLAEWARSAFPDVLVVTNPNQRGESGARNAGVAAVGTDVVVFLDDDAAAAPGWLEHLLAHYEDPEVLGVGGAADPDWQVGRPSWLPREFDWVVGCTYRGLPEEPLSVRNLMGCNMSFRRSVIEQAGGFYEGLGRTGANAFGCSETEFCIRAQQLLGGRLVFEPGARISHQVPAERTTWRYFARRCRAEGRSKAHVAGRTNRTAATASERTYVSQVLTQGVTRRIGRLGRERGAMARIATIIAGTAITTSSYALSLAASRGE